MTKEGSESTVPPHILKGVGRDQGYWSNTVLFKVTADGTKPTKGYPGDAGFDLYSAAAVTIDGGDSKDIPTGLFIALPPLLWGHIVPRSSTFRRHHIHVIDAVIDNGYRGEMYIQCVNPNRYPVSIPKGARIAQLIFHQIIDLKWEQILGRQELPPTERGQRGFGSSGI